MVNKNTYEGLVVTTFGAQLEVEDAKGYIIRCHSRKNADTIVTGDHVLYTLQEDGTGIIQKVLNRSSLISKFEVSRKPKLLAANITRMVVVNAPTPLFSAEMLDRYLVAATQQHIPVIIVLNKLDLLKENDPISDQLTYYLKLNYPVVYTSTFTKEGITTLAASLSSENAVLVGTSGVGKSSLINELSLIAGAKSGDVSEKGLGKHTTTATKLYHLKNGGNIIDSPGVREFKLTKLTINELQEGFIDIYKHQENCKFNDCLHVNEPSCAVISAAKQNIELMKRLQSYHHILKEIQQTQPHWK